VDHEPLPVMVPKLQDEIWFHGSITRQHAEALLKHVSGLYIIGRAKVVEISGLFLSLLNTQNLIITEHWSSEQRVFVVKVYYKNNDIICVIYVWLIKEGIYVTQSLKN